MRVARLCGAARARVAPAHAAVRIHSLLCPFQAVFYKHKDLYWNGEELRRWWRGWGNVWYHEYSAAPHAGFVNAKRIRECLLHWRGEEAAAGLARC